MTHHDANKGGGALLVFARAPVPGQAKTRLIPALDAAGAAQLQQQLIERTLTIATAQRQMPVALWCAPDTAHPLFQAYARRYGVTLHTQQGADVGARMAHALAQTLAHHDWALLIGTDLPALESADLLQAAAAFAAGHEAVLGPAADGGYYLIGLRRPQPELFRDIAWGSASVSAQTRQRLDCLGIAAFELRELHDLDRPEDLAHFPHLQQLPTGVPT